MTIPTTTFGSWANITTSSLTPAQYVADGLGDYAADYNVEAITGELLAQLQAKLPAGLTILGNGELIGPAHGPERDALPEDVCAHVGTLLDGEDGIDLQAIADGHDLTERAAWVHIYQLTADGRREPVQTERIESPEDAHEILRDLDDDLSATDLDCEPGTLYEVVVTADQEHDYAQLAAARVTAR